jgi:hypothetical protein
MGRRGAGALRVQYCTVQQTRLQVGNDKGEVPIASQPSGPNAILDMDMNINMDTVMDMIV